jgi:hypothetical protein
MAQSLVLEGEVRDDGVDHVFVPFEVPEGIAEIEVHLDDLSETTVLDWGLDGPSGHRGWGGGNTEPAVLNAQAASRSYLPGPIDAGTWQVVVGKARLASDPAPYRITVELRTEATLAPQPERAPYAPSPPLEQGARWYRGDLHVHSRESGDARPDLDAVADAARAAGLDFVVVTDHNVVSGSDWIVDAQARHPDVLLLPGIEFTTYDGHANALGATEWLDHRIGQPGVSVAQAAADTVAQGALLSINHPTLELGETCIGCAWSHEVPEQAVAVEVANGGWVPVGALFTPSALLWWEALADQGRRLAAVGGSDDHKAGEDLGAFDSPIGSPTTLVWAEELSHGAILEGIAAQRTLVALDGPDSPRVDWWVSGVEVDGQFVGDEQQVTAEVEGVADEVHWFVDGEEVAVTPVGEASLWVAPGDTPQRVRLEVWRDGRPTVVSSHRWLVGGAPPATVDSGPPTNPPTTGEQPVTDDASGCGCASVGGPAGGGLAGLLCLGLASARRRVRRLR